VDEDAGDAKCGGTAPDDKSLARIDTAIRRRQANLLRDKSQLYVLTPSGLE
jgi:hypothetical protein